MEHKFNIPHIQSLFLSINLIINMGAALQECRERRFDLRVGEQAAVHKSSIINKEDGYKMLSNGVEVKIIRNQNLILVQPKNDDIIKQVQNIKNQNSSKKIQTVVQQLIKIPDEMQKILQIHNIMVADTVPQIISKQETQRILQQASIKNEEIISKQPDVMPTDFKQINDGFASNGIDIDWTSKRSVSTNLSIHFLSGLMGNMLRCQYTEPQNEVEFDSLLNEEQTLKDHYQRTKTKIAKMLGVDQQIITILEVTKGSLKTCFAFNANYASGIFGSGRDIKIPAKSSLKVHPYFQKFKLSCEDFDIHGNNDDYFVKPERQDQFGNFLIQPQMRAGYQYEKPLGCKRYGLNVWDKHEDNKWLIANDPQQWVNCYHGVGCPGEKVGHNNLKIQQQLGQQDRPLILNAIMKQRILKPGYNNAYQFRKCINKEHFTCQIPEKGIYVTPHIQTALSYAKPLQIQNKKRYRLAFQCKVKPSAIHICKVDFRDQNYWVIEHSKDIRPYGILLKEVEDGQK